MRRLVFVLLALAGLWAAVAFGVEVNSMKGPSVVVAGTTAASPDSSTNIRGLATSYTIYGQDATDVFYVKCLRGGVADDVELTIPAGKSLLIPAPPPVYRASTGYWRHEFTVTAHADTVFFIPWVQ